MMEKIVTKKGTVFNGKDQVDYELISLVFTGLNRATRRRNMKLYGHPNGRLGIKTNSKSEEVEIFE